MAQTVELPISGQVTASVKVNLRQGAPSIQAPVLRKLSAGMAIPVFALVVGDSVEGNAHWYRTSDDAYAWAGAFSAIEPIGGPIPPLPAGALDPGVNLNKVPLVIDIFHGDGVVSLNYAFAAGLHGLIHNT